MEVYDDLNNTNPGWKKIYASYANFRRDGNLWFFSMASTQLKKFNGTGWSTVNTPVGGQDEDRVLVERVRRRPARANRQVVDSVAKRRQKLHLDLGDQNARRDGGICWALDPQGLRSPPQGATLQPERHGRAPPGARFL